MIGASGKRLLFDGWACGVEFKPQDLWIGLYWKRIGNCWDFWLCLLPCVPLHFSMWWHDPGQ